MTKLEEIFSELGLTKDNGLYIFKDEDWKTETLFPNRVTRLLQKRIKPDAFFCFDNKPFILFYHNPENIESLHKVIWNFNECPIVIIVQPDTVEIYNGFKYLRETRKLELLGRKEKLNDFTYFELVTGNVSSPKVRPFKS